MKHETDIKYKLLFSPSLDSSYHWVSMQILSSWKSPVFTETEIHSTTDFSYLESLSSTKAETVSHLITHSTEHDVWKEERVKCVCVHMNVYFIRVAVCLWRIVVVWMCSSISLFPSASLSVYQEWEDCWSQQKATDPKLCVLWRVMSVVHPFYVILCRLWTNSSCWNEWLVPTASKCLNLSLLLREVVYCCLVITIRLILFTTSQTLLIRLPDVCYHQ